MGSSGLSAGVGVDPLSESLDLAAQDIHGEIPQVPFDRAFRSVVTLPLCLLTLFVGLSRFGLIGDACCRAQATGLLSERGVVG